MFLTFRSSMPSFRLRFIGATEIAERLDEAQDYSIALKRCGIRSVTKNTNTDDGEPQYTYTMESLDEVTIIGAGARIVKGQGKSRSKQLRGRMYQLALDAGVEPEQFYQKQMNNIISNLESIIQYE